ncbi:kinase-like domain-containing protein [Mycena crocata]|nr:kinase-like domain-containing protein [Mycena crocata]
MFWYNHRDWLETRGYILRARYQAGWKPSWKGTKKNPEACEDSKTYMRPSIMDATHVEDGAFVMLKKISRTRYPSEVDIVGWFSEEPQRSDPENHCVPVREILQSPHDPDIQFIVMPLLQKYDKPRFDTIGEAVAFFRQILEGMRYMHKHHIVHRDCTGLNIMMDGSPMYSTPFHPIYPHKKRDWSGRISHQTRTECPVKYYLTDFGLSSRYKAEDLPVLVPALTSADNTVPEFQVPNILSDPPNLDPFPIDVYYIGNLIRQDFTEGNPWTSRKKGFEFMEPLVADMVNEDPSLRPTMDEVVVRFEEIVGGLSTWKLRSRVAKDKHHIGLFLGIAHWVRKVRLVIGKYPAIPMP